MPRVIQILENIETRLNAIHEHLTKENKVEKTESSKANTKKKRAKKGVNQRLLSFLYKNPAAKDWTANQLATALQCSKTAIIESATWKIAMSRHKTKTINCPYIEDIADSDQ